MAKIGFVLDTSLDPNDGVQQYVLRVGEWLTAQGHDVHYLVGQTEHRDIPNIHSLCRNITVKFNGNRTTIPVWASRRKLRKFLQEQQFDILHVQMPHHPFMAQHIVLEAGPRTGIIGTFHILPYTWKESLGTQLLGKLLRPSVKRFDKVLAVSPPAVDFTKKSLGVTADVLPNVVDLAWYQKNSKPVTTPGKTRIVFLGRLVLRKGALQLLQAVAALPQATRDTLEVVVAGKGPLLPELEKYAQSAKIDDIVTFSGFVPEEDKPSILGAADIAIFPSISGESFGIVLLEAMAARAGVVLGGNNPGYSSVLAPWPETLIDPMNTEVFAECLEQMITDITLRERLHTEQQAAISQYDIATVGPELVQIYEKIIAKRAGTQDNTHNE